MDDFLAEDVDIDDLLDGDDEEDIIQSPTPGSKIQVGTLVFYTSSETELRRRSTKAMKM